MNRLDSYTPLGYSLSGVVVAVGVLLDTTVVRSLLVPALVHDLGRHVWWPSRLSRTEDPVPGPTEIAAVGSGDR